MDIYTLGRMFRDYQYIPNQNSSQAKNMIIYAGGQHTARYIDFLTNYLDGKIEWNKYSYSPNCCNISYIKQTIFSNVEGGNISGKECPPCDYKYICNIQSGRCVSKTGNIGKNILKK
jgi:hypothetical protein